MNQETNSELQTKDHANPWLTLVRGPRERSWSEDQLHDVLQGIQAGMTLPKACDRAGIPRSSAYWLMHRYPELKEAIGTLYAHEGADALEDRLEEVEDGERDPRVVPAIVARLKLRGKLQSQQVQVNVPVQVNVYQGGLSQRLRDAEISEPSKE